MIYDAMIKFSGTYNLLIETKGSINRPERFFFTKEVLLGNQFSITVFVMRCMTAECVLQASAFHFFLGLELRNPYLK